jgi:hypothetical protein
MRRKKKKKKKETRQPARQREGQHRNTAQHGEQTSFS